VDAMAEPANTSDACSGVVGAALSDTAGSTRTGAMADRVRTEQPAVPRDERRRQALKPAFDLD